MRRRIITLTSIAFFLLFSPMGCEKQDSQEIPGSGEPSIQNGILSVWVSDAPFPVDLIDKAMVTVVKLELRQQEDTLFQYISEDTVSFDLLALRNGVMESLASKEVMPGSYNQLRLIIDHASIALKDGRTKVLKIPGGPQSGIKIVFNPPIRIDPGMVANVLLDFNLSRSFLLTGNPKSAKDIKGFIFKPVIRVAVIESSGTIAGKVKGLSGQPLVNAEVWVSGDSVIASTFTDRQGAYALLGIPEGTFSVTAAQEGFVTHETGGIRINAMEKTVVDFQLSDIK